MSKSIVDRRNALKLVESILTQDKNGAKKALRKMLNNKVKQKISNAINTTHLI